MLQVPENGRSANPQQDMNMRTEQLLAAAAAQRERERGREKGSEEGRGEGRGSARGMVSFTAGLLTLSSSAPVPSLCRAAFLALSATHATARRRHAGRGETSQSAWNQTEAKSCIQVWSYDSHRTS